MRFFVSILGCLFILSAYFWLCLLISSLTYGTLRSWYRVLLVTYQDTWMIILRILFLILNLNLCNISMFELKTVLHNRTRQIQELLCTITTYFQSTAVIYCRIASILSPIVIQVVNAWYIYVFSSLVCDPGIALNIWHFLLERFSDHSEFTTRRGHVFRIIKVTYTDFVLLALILQLQVQLCHPHRSWSLERLKDQRCIVDKAP